MADDLPDYLASLLPEQKLKESDTQRLMRRKYEHALRRHEADIARASQAFEEQLRDPDIAVSLGFPADLPEEAVQILRTTMAIDRRSEEQPTLAKIWDKFGE